MSSQHILDKYKVPRASVNVEALAQQLAWYLKITAEDTQFVHKHPARRDELFAELYERPEVKANVAPSQFVPLGEDPDIHLVPANAEIERLTPPKTIEDRVARVHYAAAALMVYNQYKVMYALMDHPDLRRQVLKRKTQIMNEFYNGEFIRLFPELAKRGSGTPASIPLPSTPIACPPAPGICGDPSVPKYVTTDKVKNFLRNPSTLLGTRFVHSPPQRRDQDQGDGGVAWEVISYTVRKGDRGLEHEYQVQLDSFGDDHLPMGEDEVRDLLRHSTCAT